MAIYHIISVETKQVINHKLEWKNVFERQLDSSIVGVSICEVFSSLHHLFRDIPHRVVLKEFFEND